MTSSTANFESIVTTTYPRIFKFALRLTRSKEAAEDLAQETLIRAFKSNENRLADTDPTGWFLKIAYRCFLDQLRRQSRRPLVVSLEAFEKGGREVDIADTSENPEQHFFGNQLSAPVAQALSALNPEQQELIRMAFLEEVSHEQIAQVFGCSLPSIRIKIHRAVAAMRREMGSQSNISNPFSLKEEAFA